MLKPTVLYVDDELNNLTSFKAAFRSHFNIYTAQSASIGLKILQENEVHVVVTDQRMPEITGIEFLESIIKIYPYPTRVLLTGYADIQDVINAINKGQVYRYVRKPWNEEILKDIINDSYNLYTIRVQNNALLDRYKTIFENSNEAIYISSTEGKLIDFNDATCKLLGYSRNELVKMNNYSLTLENPEEITKIIDAVKKRGFIDNYFVKLKTKQNTLLSCLLSLKTIYSSGGSPIGRQGIIKNISKEIDLYNKSVRGIIEEQERERDVFAKQLHDSISQQLSGINFYIQSLKGHEKKSFDLNQNLNEINNSLAKVFAEIRELCFDIMPRALSDFGIVHSIKELMLNLKKTSSVEILLKENIEKPLAKNIEVIVFRVIQELLEKLSKHTKEIKSITIHLNAIESLQLALEVIMFPKYNFGAICSKEDFNTIRSKVALYNGSLLLKANAIEILFN